MMSIRNSSTISDEEILEELKKLGYEEISSDIFAVIKDDLEKMIRKELLNSSSFDHNFVKNLPMSNADSTHTLKKFDKTRKVFCAVDARCQHLHSPEQANQSETRSLNSIYSENNNISVLSNQKSKLTDSSFSPDSLTSPFKNIDINSYNSFPLKNSKNMSYRDDLNLKKGNPACKNKQKSARCNISDELKSIFFNNSSEVQDSTMAIKSNEHSIISVSSTSSNEKIMKRKVLRHINGKRYITEEIISIPFFLDTSYPESPNLSSSKSFSSDDLSPESNSSSGSMSVISPKPLRSSSSTLSLSSRPSTAMRIMNSRKKKHDPVTRYGYYKKFWDNFKPPGEKSHDKLRWSVRDKMLDYHL